MEAGFRTFCAENQETKFYTFENDLILKLQCWLCFSHLFSGFWFSVLLTYSEEPVITFLGGISSEKCPRPAVNVCVRGGWGPRKNFQWRVYIAIGETWDLEEFLMEGWDLKKFLMLSHQERVGLGNSFGGKKRKESGMTNFNRHPGKNWSEKPDEVTTSPVIRSSFYITAISYPLNQAFPHFLSLELGHMDLIYRNSISPNIFWRFEEQTKYSARYLESNRTLLYTYRLQYRCVEVQFMHSCVFVFFAPFYIYSQF